MADWNQLLDDPLFNAGLGLLGGAATPNPWGVAADQLNKYQALRQNRELQKIHSKLYEAQARKVEQDALEAERARADAERARQGSVAWAMKQQDPRIRDAILAGIVAPKDLSQEYSKTLYPTLQNEAQFDVGTGLERRVLRDPRATEAIPFGGMKKEAPPPSTTVNVGGSSIIMPKELSKAAADILSDSKTKTEGAMETLSSVAQIKDALDSGKVRLGPGASLIQGLDQIGLALGYGGKDAAERVANTRMAIQGLAKQELATASQMKGQGTITENERLIIRRAAAGDIDSLSEPELRVLLPALEKTANFRVNAHNRMVEQTEKNYPGSTAYFGVQGPAGTAPAGKQVVRRVPLKNGKIGIEYSDGTRVVE